MRIVISAIVFIAASIAACSMDDHDGLVLGKGVRFRLIESETIAHPAKKVALDHYASIMNDYDSVLQIPLYRQIHGSVYDIFVGLAVTTDTTDPARVVVSDTSAKILEYTRADDGTSILLYKQSTYAYVFFPTVCKNPRFVLTMLCKDEMLARQWYQAESLNKRLSSE